MTTRRSALLALGSAGALGTAHAAGFGDLMKGVQGVAATASLTDDQVKSNGQQMIRQMDAKAPVAPDAHPLARRLGRLTAGLSNDSGLDLNFRLYLVPEINAFAVPDGSIRIYAGLMDAFTDDEIRYVIGHEIGHIAAGHSKKRMQVSMAASTGRQLLSAGGGKAAALAESEVGALFEQVIKAQHSQGNEREADDFAFAFMGRKSYDRQACVTALDKLAALGGGQSNWLSTHPSPKERADRMRTALKG